MGKMNITDNRAPLGELYYTNMDSLAIIKFLSRKEGYSSIGWNDPNSDSLEYEDLWSGDIGILDSKSVMARHFHLIEKDNQQYIIDRIFDGS